MTSSEICDSAVGMRRTTRKGLRSRRSLPLILLTILALTCRTFAAENPPDVYAEIAAELFQSLPKDATVAIQPLTEEETKIPAAILQSIEVGLTAALQRASGFEIKLIARDKLQTIWKEAREFSNKKFEDLVADAGADVLLIGEVRPTSDGVEISYRAFRIKGSGTGTVLASTKPRILALDWQKELGAKPTEITDTMKEMAEALKRLAASGGLVADPKSPADYYHNARILAQRGEVDLAMASYEQLFKFPILYADPVIDLLTLATRVYGKDGASLYLNRKLKPIMPNDLFLLGSQLIADQPLIEIERIIFDDKLSYPPLASYFLEKTKSYLTGSERTIHLLEAASKAVAIVRKSYDIGEFLGFFLDQLRGEQNARMAFDFEQEIDKVKKDHSNVYFGKAFISGNSSDISFFIHDHVDRSKESRICFHSKAGVETCGNPDKYAKQSKQNSIMNTNDTTTEWSGITGVNGCIYSISYYDIRGFSNTIKADEFQPRGRACIQ